MLIKRAAVREVSKNQREHSPQRLVESPRYHIHLTNRKHDHRPEYLAEEHQNWGVLSFG